MKYSNYLVLNRIPNNDIWLRTKYQLFANNIWLNRIINYSVSTLVETNNIIIIVALLNITSLFPSSWCR